MAEYSFKVIDENDFDTGQLIDLNKELIRLIERDIDEAKSGALGLTPWTVAAALGSVGFLFFSIAKEVVDIPFTAIILIAIAIVFFYYLLSGIIRTYISAEYAAKPGRLYQVREAYKPDLPVWVIRLLFLLLIDFIIYDYWLSDTWYHLVMKIIGYICVLIPQLLIALLVITFFRNDYFGNNPDNKKISQIFSAIGVLAYLLLTIFSFYELKTLSFSGNPTVTILLGVLAALFLILFEAFCNLSISPAYVSSLRDLKDDIVFRRVELNDGLIKYRIIREGKQLIEAVSSEFNQLYNLMDQRDILLDTRKHLLQEMTQTMPSSNDIKETIERKKQALDDFFKSLSSIESTDSEMNEQIISMIETFVDRSNKLATASGDQDNLQIIHNIFINKERRYAEEIESIRNQGVNMRENYKKLLEPKATIKPRPTDSKPKHSN